MFKEINDASTQCEKNISLLQNLVRMYHQLPSQYYISDVKKVDQNPFSGGGFSVRNTLQPSVQRQPIVAGYLERQTW